MFCQFFFLLTIAFQHDVAFEDSVGTTRLGSDFICHHTRDSERYDLYKAVWEKNHCKVGSGSIPKVIHQINLSGKPLSKNQQKYQKSWIDNHPRWKYKLWTLDSVKGLPADIQDEIVRAETRMEKEDVLRLYILDTEGGLVVDMAESCLQPLDAFHENFHFYASLEAPLGKAKFSRRLHVATSFIACVPHHPIIKRWQSEIESFYATGQHEDGSIVRAARSSEKRPLLRYLLFGQAVDKELDSSEFINIILPPTYAFPLNARWADSYEKREKKAKRSLKAALVAKMQGTFNLFKAAPFSEIQEESVAWHTEGGTWR